MQAVPAATKLPFESIRSRLYSSLELLRRFDPQKPESFIHTLDFRTYHYFVANGESAPTDPYAGMMEALHDNSIMLAMTALLKRSKKPAVAIMGGHSEKRGSDDFASVVHIARRLTNVGCLVASGGGPGAMEATHLGALLATATNKQVDAAIKKLANRKVAELPNSAHLFDEQHQVNMEVVKQLHAWARPAYEIAVQHKGGGESLAVPTWYYGSEPISPLATKVAKYFQNSIREDVLLGLAANGIIYTPGASGTLQEVFQDAAQNFNRKLETPFAPMIFFGKDFWTKTLPVRRLLKALFVDMKGPDGSANLSSSDFDRYVTIVNSVDEAVDKLLQHKPSKVKTAERMQSLGFGPMMASVR